MFGFIQQMMLRGDQQYNIIEQVFITFEDALGEMNSAPKKEANDEEAYDA
jgi:hypothetical protein